MGLGVYFCCFVLCFDSLTCFLVGLFDCLVFSSFGYRRLDVVVGLFVLSWNNVA